MKAECTLCLSPHYGVTQVRQTQPQSSYTLNFNHFFLLEWPPFPCSLSPYLKAQFNPASFTCLLQLPGLGKLQGDVELNWTFPMAMKHI